MPSLKEVRNRIDSVRSTEQITNAMKMVAASKLRRAQDAIVKLRPYASKLNEIISNISETLDSQAENPFGKWEEPSDRALIIAISSNKGLCGNFNANIIKGVNALINGQLKSYADLQKLDIICIGRKAYEHFIRRKLPVIAEHNHLFSQLTYEKVEPLCNSILNSYLEGKWGRVVIVYNQFRNAAVQQVTEEEFLPVQSGFTDENPSRWGVEYLFEPGKETILQDLIPQALRIQFFKTVLDSFASEHGARMTAMHKATDNAGEMLKELKLAYNKARQAAITREIIEIVGGAEALKG